MQIPEGQVPSGSFFVSEFFFVVCIQFRMLSR
jgi:hypothetical protein